MEAFLRPFLRRGPIVIAIPELGRIDIESLSAVRPLLRAARGHDLRFLIGHDPDVAASAPIDVLVRAAKLRILAMLEVLPGSTVVAHLEARPIPPTTVRDPLDDGLEARAFEALAASAPARGVSSKRCRLRSTRMVTTRHSVFRTHSTRPPTIRLVGGARFI